MVERIIFLDRDGVINKDPGAKLYITRWEDFEFIPGSIEAIKKLYENEFKIFIISNQAGIGKKLFSMNELNQISNNMLREIENNGVKIEGMYYCPHTDEQDCDCRKPKIGMLKEAVKNKDIDFSDTFFIGDGRVDIEAGKRIDSKTILVLSGKTHLEDIEHWQVKPDYIKSNLLEASEFILAYIQLKI